MERHVSFVSLFGETSRAAWQEQLHLLGQLIVGDTEREQRTTLPGEDIGRGAVYGDLVYDRNNICPLLALEPSAASKASAKPGHHVVPANDTGYLITLLIGQVSKLGR